MPSTSTKTALPPEYDVTKIMKAIVTPALQQRKEGNKNFDFDSLPPLSKAEPLQAAIIHETNLAAFMRDERIRQLDTTPLPEGAKIYTAGDPGKGFEDRLKAAYVNAGLAEGDAAAQLLVEKTKTAVRKQLDKGLPLPGQVKG